MFAFFQERGSLMEDWPAVDRAQWRRVQLARFIIDYAGGRLSAMRFDAQGRIVDFGISRARLEELIGSGTPFRTSGCPGALDTEVSACNRPYGDSGPTDVRSFPFAPGKRDIQRIRRQLCGEDVAAGR
jgi:biotin synthase-related radical SAM superfamily protein